MRTLKIWDLKQANYFIRNGANVLSVNIDYTSGKTYVKFEVNHCFKQLMTKWQNKEI